MGRDIKGKLWLVLYVLGIALAVKLPLLAYGAYVLIPIMWFIPDRRLAIYGDVKD